MSKPVYLEPRSAAVLAHMVAYDRPVTAAEIGRDSGLHPRGTPQTWAELGRSLARPLLEHRLALRAGRAPIHFIITERGRIAIALFRVITTRKLKGDANGQPG
ncbi:hypothetical protein ABIF65_003839 [Bradyrhizobium japonicum]|jgi:hypothetical protein|uniref:MarR family transcriptional regulator n=2 Tax=Bradyrhizobium japonicum TaxID=375 RepID=A0A0A3Y159_BRAJP|nr:MULTISPECIES: hypothetical protein [Bradyrhizobium]KGT79309.1 hypothetical protein MA20_12905 [Bradyrhizobium japonicum]MBR0945242.1 hypothetical protein [Bradyrhizobium liaoningense]MBR1003941.1 hypothetical protein [Bradyrhizobium liaoningense]MBR1070332.1 hypothetical protein [Bradyrhizobium liaoningense]MCP1779513.1 hypothetical protein [Bradyrhizobium japonicum]